VMLELLTGRKSYDRLLVPWKGLPHWSWIKLSLPVIFF
jgi:hypothetical protein